MQIQKAKATPIELTLQHPIRIANVDPITHITAVFVRLETVEGRTAWGCAVAHPDLTGETPEHLLKTCQEVAHAVPDLHPTNLEYSLTRIEGIAKDSPGTLCAYDLVFHDMLGLAAGMPLYRLLGGYRTQVQTSATIPVASVEESIERAKERARRGFKMLKVKGGTDPDTDIQRMRAIKRALPEHILWLDADGGYTVEQALDVARALKGKISVLEQPTPPGDQDALARVTNNSPIPIFADQSVCDPASALSLAANRAVGGMSIKMATCGGFRGARQIDAIARAARLMTMVSCVIEPSLLIAAGLHFALSSPSVEYVDLDGHLELVHDPTAAGFELKDGCFTVRDVPGLGCTVDL
ncbi:MAG TPA: dipeptide epimerase [Anaerolineales bacterium]|nr:dipeptide epimerase [Anaerolineales bacterium]